MIKINRCNKFSIFCAFCVFSFFMSSCHASKPEYKHLLIAFQNPCIEPVKVDIDLNEAGKHSRNLPPGSTDEIIFKGVIPKLYQSMDKRFVIKLSMGEKTIHYDKTIFSNKFPAESDSNQDITKWIINVGEICSELN